MDYKRWVDLFGKAAEEEPLRSALVSVGITKVKIPRDGLAKSFDLVGQGMMITFTDESILKPDGILGHPILSAVMMMLQPGMPNPYRGPLPYGLTQNAGQSALRTKFGAPIEKQKEFAWDRYAVGDLHMTVHFAEDFKSIHRLTLRIPQSTT